MGTLRLRRRLAWSRFLRGQSSRGRRGAEKGNRRLVLKKKKRNVTFLGEIILFLLLTDALLQLRRRPHSVCPALHYGRRLGGGGEVLGRAAGVLNLPT